MSRYVDIDTLKIPSEEMIAKWIVNSAPSIDIIMCPNCRKCKEQGGHANCNGYLYCTRQKTLVDEDCFCSWGERREP